MREPATPIEVYKAIIDRLVNETRTLGASQHVLDQEIFSNAPDHRDFNNFIQSLNPAQRALLARILQEEREGAIHDVLAAMSWWIDARGVGLTFRGEPMPVDLSGMGLHGDYVGRRDGWDWPADGSDSSS